MKAKAIELLRRYTGKREIYLTSRGNKSILLALKIAKSMGKKAYSHYCSLSLSWDNVINNLVY